MRIVETNLERYGVENPQQNKEIHDKTQSTVFAKYGVDCTLKDEAIQAKAKANKYTKIWRFTLLTKS